MGELPLYSRIDELNSSSDVYLSRDELYELALDYITEIGKANDFVDWMRAS